MGVTEEVEEGFREVDEVEAIVVGVEVVEVGNATNWNCIGRRTNTVQAASAIEDEAHQEAEEHLEEVIAVAEEAEEEEVGKQARKVDRKSSSYAVQPNTDT